MISLKSIFEALNKTTEKKYSGSGCNAYNYLYSYSEKPCKCKKTDFAKGWFSNADCVKTVFLNQYTEINYKRSELFKGYGKNTFTKAYKEELEENIFGNNIPDSFVSDFSNSIEKSLAEHCSYFFYVLKIKKKGQKTPERPKITDIEKCKIQNSKSFENNLSRFEQLLLNNIAITTDWQNDYRFIDSHLKDILDDSNIENSIKLGILTILSLIPCDEKFNAFTDHAYGEVVNDFIDRMYNLYCSAGYTLTKDAVWAAGKLWYEESRESESRFSEFDPIVNLFPLVDLSKMVPKDNPSEKKRDKKLLSVISDTPGHLFLVGEGGIGKTTVLYHIMKDAYSKNSANDCKDIPLYIELSKAISKKDFDKEDKWSNYIINSIQRQLQKQLDTDTVSKEEIERIFMENNSDKPAFVLLLDGLNEISIKELYGTTVYSMVVSEIKHIMDNWKNVRVILTSRSKNIFEDNITTLELLGIDDEYIYEYLEKSVSQSKIDFVKNNQTLLETLRVPLFLTIFAEIENVDELLSRGEILDAFFTQTKEKLYTEQSNYLRIQREHLSLQANTAITLAMASFIYDFVIPEIAWEMVQKNSFQISETRIEEIIREVLVDEAKESPYCWAHGNDCFSEDYKSRFNESPNDVKQRFIDGFGEKKAPSIIRRFITNQLGILKPIEKPRNKHGFVHQHYRDYFAALYHIKRLKLAIYVNEDPDINNYFLAREYLSEWRKPLPSQVLIFIGEILGEVHNIPQYIKEENRWIFEPKNDYIKRGLDIYRFEDKSERISTERREGNRYAVGNLFQILKLVRKDLSGEDFSNLDLTICHANGNRLGNNTLSANFDGSILTDTFFVPSGHTSTIRGVCFSPDNRCILTMGSDGTAILWNAVTYEVLWNYSVQDGYIVSLGFHPVDRVLFTASIDGNISFWNYDECSISHVHTYKTGIAIENALYGLNGKCVIILSFDNNATIFDSDTFENITDKYGDVFKEEISYIHFSPKGNYIITIPSDEDTADSIIIWNNKTPYKPIRKKIIPFSFGIESAQFSPDEKTILVTLETGGAFIVDVNSTNPIAHLEHGFQFQFSPISGKYILGSGNGIILYETKTGKILQQINDNNDEQTFAQYSLDGKLFISYSYSYNLTKPDKDPVIWDASSFARVPEATLKNYTKGLSTALFTPDSKKLITLSQNGVINVWTIAQSLNEVSEGVFLGNNNRFRSIDYSTNGENIVTVSYDDDVVTVWNANTQEEIKAIEADYGIISAQLNPENKQILTLQISATAKAWSIETRVLNANEVLNHASSSEELQYVDRVCLVVSAQYSHDGKHIATVSIDGTVTIWNSSELSDYRKFKSEDWINHDSFLLPRSSPRVQYDSNDEKLVFLLTDNDFGVIEVRDANQFNLIASRELKYTTWNSVLAVSPKDEYIVTSHWDDQRNTGIVRLWTMELKAVKNGVLEFDNQLIKSVQFSPNGTYLLIISSQEDLLGYTNQDNTTIWHIKTEQSSSVSISKIFTIPNYPGLEVWNVNLQNINEHSDISSEMRKHLVEYGAIINEEESQHEHILNDSEITTHKLR